MHHPVAVAVLLGLAVLLALACSIGVAVMRTPLERLHYTAPVVSIGMALIIAAVWVDEADPQARTKIILIGIVLFVMNAVLTNATAKAIRVRQAGHWEPHAEENIPVEGRPEPAGAFGATEEHEA